MAPMSLPVGTLWLLKHRDAFLRAEWQSVLARDATLEDTLKERGENLGYFCQVPMGSSD